MSSAERFGYEWQRYNFLLPVYERQFRNWIGPLGPSDFRGRSVLDAGCGMGRNSYWVCGYGASRVLAFDFDQRSVKAAKKTLEKFPQARVEYQSIYEISYTNEFDLVMSIGVVHHLSDPVQAIKNLFRAVKPGGKLVLWVYGRENNGWKIAIVNSVRGITSRLPVVLTHAIAYFFSVPLFILAKLAPFKGPYLSLLSQFKFIHVHHTVFDQLIPTVANYWTRAEVMALLGHLDNVASIDLSHVLDYSWSAVVTKK